MTNGARPNRQLCFWRPPARCALTRGTRPRAHAPGAVLTRADDPPLKPTLSASRFGRSGGARVSALSAARVKQLTLAACILGSSIALLDGTVVNVALPTIQREPRRGACGPAVDLQRLPADARLADPRRRLARGPVRRAARLCARRRRVRGGLAALRVCAHDRLSDRLPCAAGRRGRAADPELACGDRRDVRRV